MSICDRCGQEIETGEGVQTAPYRYVIAWNRFGDVEFFMPAHELSDEEAVDRVMSMELRARFNSQRDIQGYYVGTQTELELSCVAEKAFRELVKGKTKRLF